MTIEQRPKFDTLFADPRHYRSECRLLRTAIRRGWLNDGPQADRDALVHRFEQATAEREAAGFDSDGQRSRAVLAQGWVALELQAVVIREVGRVLRYAWAGKLNGRMTGRPRERWHVTDYPNRIDANELRRQAKADGADLRTLDTIIVRRADDPDDAGERVSLAVVADARYRWRVWLVCPRCGCRRMHLFPFRAGLRCRTCTRIGYAQT